MNNELKITDIESLLKVVGIVSKKFSGQVWWRGQRDYSWELIPSVFRGSNAKNEKSSMLRFQQKAPSRYARVPSIDEWDNWLFLMQHHNLPTRLLDWTESPLIASFFASEVDAASIDHPKIIKDSDGVIYALSPYRLNELQAQKKELLMPESNEAKEIIKCAFEEKKTDFDRIIAIRPAEVHIRLLAQLSTFTLHGSKKLLTELPASDEFLLKFRIPESSKKSLREELKRLGIRLSNIFPDLDNLAKDIRSSNFVDDKPNYTKTSATSYVSSNLTYEQRSGEGDT